MSSVTRARPFRWPSALWDFVDWPRLSFALAAAAGLGLSVFAVAVVLYTPGSGDRNLIALARLSVVAVPVGVGLWVWYTRATNRFGRVLVTAGLIWGLANLSESSNAVVYSAGRVASWVAGPVIFWVILSFPTGRLNTKADRVLVGAAAALIGLLFIPTALIVDQYSLPSYDTSCVSCPHNAFMLTHAQPHFVDAWLAPLRTQLAWVLHLAVLVVLIIRLQVSSRLMRRALLPVVVLAGLRVALNVVFLNVRLAAPHSPVVPVLGWLVTLSLPALAIAFLAGLVRADLFAGAALKRLASRLRQVSGPDQLTSVLREALADPSLILVYPASQGWVGDAGRPVAPPALESGQVLTEVRDGDRLVAGVIHDAALRDQPEFVDAAASLALESLENHRLEAKVDSSLHELARSRARIQSAADGERRRIERDLHDGAQQHLVALRIRLGLAADLLREDPARGAAYLRELEGLADGALEDVRSLAHGVYPSLLAEHGLAPALGAVARNQALPTRVEASGIGRYPPAIEEAVYFCCLEALQNAAKHAQGASSFSVTLSAERDMRLEVRDDGAGFSLDEAKPGAGFVNMHDRLATVGGRLDIQSRSGGGTRVMGTIPLPS